MLTRRQFFINALISGIGITLPLKLWYNCDEVFCNNVFPNNNLWFLHSSFLNRLYSGITVPFMQGHWAYCSEYDLILPIKKKYTIFELNKYFQKIQNRINKKYFGLEDQSKYKGEAIYFFRDQQKGVIYPSTIRIYENLL